VEISGRVKKNLGLEDVDVVKWCRERILDNDARIERNGKYGFYIV
jgi:hypothetical protein